MGYFCEDIDDLLAAHSDRVLCVVEDLARARAALAVSPAEAQWYLSRAVRKWGRAYSGSLPCDRATGDRKKWIKGNYVNPRPYEPVICGDA